MAARPPLVALKDIRLQDGPRPLFEGVDLAIEPRMRACLVGRNGAGKSTLMKLVMGLVEPDSGDRTVQGGTRFAYVPQEPHISGETLLDYAVSGGAQPWIAETWLETFGLAPAKAARGLSGGEIRRAALAKAFAEEPDVLLLDEPTNHLDILAIERLEQELAASRMAVLTVSHDRAFLNKVSNACFWLENRQVRTLNRGFAHFDDWADQVMSEEAESLRRLSKAIESETHAFYRSITGRRTRNEGRARQLRAMRADRAERLRDQPRDLNLDVDSGVQSGKRVAELKGVTKSFSSRPPAQGAQGHAPYAAGSVSSPTRTAAEPRSGGGGEPPAPASGTAPSASLPGAAEEDRVILKPFSTRILRGDRVAIVGPNGAGKTTLVKIMLGELEPDSGSVKLGVGLEPVYLDQARADLTGDMTLREALTPGGGDSVMVRGTPKHVAAYARDFLFTEAQLRQPVSTLSGGERNRLLLARALAKPANLLVLDEPTNDLDMDTLDRLEELLDGYDGTLILVSHDRDFVDRLATSTIALNGRGDVVETPGGWTDFIRQNPEFLTPSPSPSGAGPSPRGGDEAGAARQDRAEIAAPASPGAARRSPPQGQGEGRAKPRAKLSYKDARRLEEAERQIADLPEAIAAHEAKLADPDLYARDPAAFQRLTDELQALRDQLDAAETDWLELEEKKAGLAE